MQDQINAYKTYQQLAKKYSEKIDYKPHNALYDRPNTLSLLPDLKGKKVLDAGCGPGKYAQELIAKGAEVTGIDLSDAMIEEAKKRNPGQGDFFVHDLTTPLKFDNESFDVVVCPLVLEYIYDWHPVFNEFNRILKPGGVFVYSVIHPTFDYNYYKSDKYFQVEKVIATWKSFGTPIKMESFRRSMMDSVNPLMECGFTLDKILEPYPVPEFKIHDPKHYRELIKFPAFICFRAIKRN